MPGVQIHMATAISDLIDQIDLSKESVFSKTTFVTQTTGIEHYLSIQLAKREGVFANAQYLTPNEIMVQVARLLGNYQSQEFHTEHIRWRIFKLLDDPEFKEKFTFVAGYYQSDGLKKIQLATKLADLFDQYIVYRSDMVYGWQEGRFALEEASGNEEWQRWLWLRIKEDIGSDYKDKAEFQRSLIQKLQSGDSLSEVSEVFPVVHVFGLTVLTKFHMEVLWHLRNVCQVNFYFINPCIDDFWYDSMSDKDLVRKWWWHKDRASITEFSKGNNLLTSWGKVVQELFVQFFELDDEVFSHLQYHDSTIQKTTLLGQIQREIRGNVRGEDRESISLEQLQDDSLVISSNYSKLREVQVFYDYLVNLIEEKYEGDLEPSDVVVMLPQVEDYVPYIRSVFDSGPKNIPYSIGDRSLVNDQSVMSVCLSIFEVISENLTSESVLQLLDFELVRNRYGVSDLAFVRKAVLDLNVRQGLDGDAQFETNFVGWEQGLFRMVFGVFSRDLELDFEGEQYAVFNEVEGGNVEEVLSFVSFVRSLIVQSKIVRKDRSLSEWNEYFLKMLYGVVILENEGDEEMVSIKAKLDQLDEIDSKLNGIHLSFESYIYLLKTVYQNERIGDGYYRGRVTFCQALPMRSIPFKVVAFLGLNKKDFPRVGDAYAFDLIEVSNQVGGRKKVGDRDIKSNDKYLFLEALLCAQDSLYLSYEGRSNRNNKEQLPSGLVEELVDYLQVKSSADIKQELLTEYPLRSFSKKYVKEGQGLFTYLAQNRVGEFEKHFGQASDLVQDSVVDFNDLIRFYSHSFRYYYQTKLKVFYNEDDVLVPESEVMFLDNNLHKYKLKQRYVDGEDFSEHGVKELKKEGLLPLANFGEIALESLLEKNHELKESYFKELNRRVKSGQSISCKIAQFQVGLEDELIDDDVLKVCLSATNYKIIDHAFEVYMKWLFLNAAGKPSRATMLYLKNDKVAKYVFLPELFGESSRVELEQFVEFYVENKDRLVSFTPALVRNYFNKKEDDSFEKVMRKSLDLDFNNYSKSAFYGGVIDENEILQLGNLLMSGFKSLVK